MPYLVAILVTIVIRESVVLLERVEFSHSIVRNISPSSVNRLTPPRILYLLGSVLLACLAGLGEYLSWVAYCHGISVPHPSPHRVYQTLGPTLFTRRRPRLQTLVIIVTYVGKAV